MGHNTSIYWQIICIAVLAGLVVCGAHPSLAQQGSKVLATVNGQKITEADLNQLVAAAPKQLRQFYLSPEGRQKHLEYVVNVLVLAMKAKKEGLDKTPRAKHLWDYKKNELLAQLYLEQLSKNTPQPSEQEAKAFYEKNKDQYSSPESVHLHHILVGSEKDARRALQQIKKGSVKFADLARKISTCPSKQRGGDLSWMPKGSLVPEVEKAAFSMKKGEIKGPVKSKFGYHILYVEDKRPETIRKFEEVKPYIIGQLKFEHQQKSNAGMVKALRKEMKVTMSTPAAPKGPQSSTPAPGPTSGPKK